MITKPIKDKRRIRRHIKVRGHEVLRIEGFSDAIFAFAMTLLVVSLEVPKTFEELQIGMSGMAGFAICFGLLFFIWHDQYIFFRHYYLNDTKTIFLNALLLFTVLFYVYPLKFLFSLLISGNDFIENGVVHEKIKSALELRHLMEIYGFGFFLVYFVFFLLYQNALKHKEYLQLNLIEIFHTKTEMYKQSFMMLIGIVSVTCAALFSDNNIGMSGMIYIAIGPVITILIRLRFSKMRKIFTSDQLKEHDDWVNI